jgi:hypothetical protein
MMMALYAFASPGAGPFLAVAPTVGLIGAWLAHFRRFAP